MTRAVWLNDDGTEPEPTPATTTHTPQHPTMFTSGKAVRLMEPGEVIHIPAREAGR